MNRFSEESAAGLMGNYSRYRALHVWGEDIDQRPELTACDGCGAGFAIEELHAVDDGTPIPLFVCATCKAEMEHEPACTCRRVDVDLLDARGCEAHGEPVARPAAALQAHQERKRIEPMQATLPLKQGEAA